MVRCPYNDCPYEGTAREVEEHIGYSVMMDDEDHREDKLNDRH